MTKIINFAMKIKGGGREGGTCEVLRPCHPPKIWNVHLINFSLLYFKQPVTGTVLPIYFALFIEKCKINWTFLEGFFGFDSFFQDWMLPKKWCLYW